MPKNWKLKPKIPGEMGGWFKELPPLADQLLFNRGLKNPEEAEAFLRPKYEHLHDPFLFQDMEKAVQRIWQGIENNEKIYIYGDYDADAVTANAVLQQLFRYLGVKVRSYIPDRFTEGYGINLDALSKIKDEGSKIIITVDCGTNSTDAADFCNANGIDFIITDHHEVIGELPKAFALINPKNPGDTYPCHEITGVGVAFKLACGLLADGERVSRRFEDVGAAIGRPHQDGRMISAPTTEGAAVALRLPAAAVRSGHPATHVAGWEKWLLDLVAIGTVADCHSLIGENRILVKFGLQVLAKTRWTGLRALMASAGLLQENALGLSSKISPIKTLDTYTLGFILAPRLNAAGRLEHASIALDVLLETDPIEALQMAQALETINQRRQDQTARMLSEAKEQVEFIKDRKVLVLAREGWSKGVVGLVAGKIAEEYHKPAFVLAKENGEATGSARTVGEFNVVEALKFASDYLTRFGGHEQAAGLTLKEENFELFYQKVLEYADSHLSDEDLESRLSLETELSESQLSQVTCQLLQLFEPFGVGNPRPKFLIPGARAVSSRCVGAAMQHLQMQLRIGSTPVAAIMFNCSDFEKNLAAGQEIDIAGELMLDEWNGRKNVKIRVVDIKLHERA